MSEIKAGNGAAVVFNGTDVTVTYSSGGTTINNNGNTTPSIYLPVTNPASTTLKLDTVKVVFTGGGTGSAKAGEVTDFEVYYGATSIYSTGSGFTYTSTWTQTVVNASKLPDDGSYGILVTLNLSLPDSGSFITLYSVDLAFK
jgi:hypothetical protein